MKAAFLCERAETVARVYGELARAAIRAVCELDEDAVSSSSLAASARPDVEWAFSTWGMPALDAGEIARALPNLKAIFYGAGSVQAFARPFLERGVRVFSAWRANAVPVAEFTVASIILANKGYYRRAGAPRGTRADYPGNYGCRVGVIGAGCIGRMVLERLGGFELEKVVCDPFLTDEAARALGAKKVSLQELFATCQTITNHVANNEQTRGMFNYALFSLMKPNATFINTGRGAQVVEADLARALREKPGATALLDVTFPEPPEAGHPFYCMENVILTPHMAGSEADEVRRMGMYMAEEAGRMARGEAPLHEVTVDMLATMA